MCLPVLHHFFHRERKKRSYLPNGLTESNKKRRGTPSTFSNNRKWFLIIHILHNMQIPTISYWKHSFASCTNTNTYSKVIPIISIFAYCWIEKKNILYYNTTSSFSSLQCIVLSQCLLQLVVMYIHEFHFNLFHLSTNISVAIFCSLLLIGKNHWATQGSCHFNCTLF